MAQYAHLSTPDPEFAALVGKVPPLDLKTDDIPALQERWIQYGQPAWKAAYLKRLRPGERFLPSNQFVVGVYVMICE